MALYGFWSKVLKSPRKHKLFIKHIEIVKEIQAFSIKRIDIP